MVFYPKRKAVFGFYRDRPYLPLYGLLDLQFALSHSAKLVAGEHCVHCPDGCDRGVPVHADRAESHSCEHWPQVQPVSTTSRIVQYRQQLLQQPVLKWIVTTFQCSKTACTEYRYLISFAHHICPCCKKKSENAKIWKPFYTCNSSVFQWTELVVSLSSQARDVYRCLHQSRCKFNGISPPVLFTAFCISSEEWWNLAYKTVPKFFTDCVCFLISMPFSIWC